MNFNELISKLEKFSNTVNNSIVAITIFDAVLVIIIGVISANLTDTISKIFLVVIAVLYLLLLLIRTAYTKNFPGSITNELKSERELTNLKRNADRQREITSFIVSSMQNLNGQTCAIGYSGDSNLCDAGLQEGIYKLIEPLIRNANFLLNITNTKFTIGVYLDSYLSLDVSQHGLEKGVIVLDDRLYKRDLLIKDLFVKVNLRDEQLSIQSALINSFNNFKFYTQDYLTKEGREFSIFCSPMPIACDEMEKLGVLFIIGEKADVEIPEDLSTNLTIFNRVIANWIYRYNECINSRVLAIINRTTPLNNPQSSQ